AFEVRTERRKPDEDLDGGAEGRSRTSDEMRADEFLSAWEILFAIALYLNRLGRPAGLGWLWRSAIIPPSASADIVCDSRPWGALSIRVFYPRNLLPMHWFRQTCSVAGTLALLALPL